jgi:hypothetical protein
LNRNIIITVEGRISAITYDIVHKGEAIVDISDYSLTTQDYEGYSAGIVPIDYLHSRWQTHTSYPVHECIIGEKFKKIAMA